MPSPPALLGDRYIDDVEVIPYVGILWACFQIMKSEVLRVTHELQAMKDKIKENSEKIKVNKTLPYLVSNVIEVSFLYYL